MDQRDKFGGGFFFQADKYGCPGYIYSNIEYVFYMFCKIQEYKRFGFEEILVCQIKIML